MKPSKQDIFNQYRENTIIEVVQALSKSEAGSHIVFKGGTALKLFYGLPRYGVPVISPEPSFLMTEKVITFVDRQAGRDFFDAWFILNNAYPLDERLILNAFDDISQFYQTLLEILKKTDSKKIHRDTGKLLSLDHRNWIITSFLSDFERLIVDRLRALNR
jgi:predicted nucleotidyltransferase component of viral defense system